VPQLLGIGGYAVKARNTDQRRQPRIGGAAAVASVCMVVFVVLVALAG
jgi:hypothetical protein